MASTIDGGHQSAECSNKGICQRDTGTCLCQAGYEGKSCERQSCPNACSNNGRCVSMSTSAAMQDPGELITSCSTNMICGGGGSCTTPDYSNCRTTYQYSDIWDSEMVYGCICDEGYHGSDCSLRNCPKGDDPLTGMAADTNGVSVNEKQIITCQANGGTFTLTFKGETTNAISFDATLSQLTAAFESLTTVKNDFGSATTVSYTGTNTKACTDDGNPITIEFTQNFGDQPLVIPDGSLLTHSSNIFDPIITSSVSITGTKESAFCSDRGICDTDTGICTCSTGYDTSDGYNGAGQRGDCGRYLTQITSCPGEVQCNSRGVCTGPPTYKCMCSNGFTGADCAEMVCPSGKNWFSNPSADNKAHDTTSECSGAGLCDREAGSCTCFDGYEGSACERMKCPGDPACSGQGTCLTMGLLAQRYTNNGDVAAITYGATPNNPLTWDSDKVQGCLCDDGFEGYDCSLKSCPYGDDPESDPQYNEIQTILCDEASGTDGTFSLSFRTTNVGEAASTITLGYDSLVADVEAALEALPTITDVNVYLDDANADATSQIVCDNGGTTFHVEFFSPTGDVPLLIPTTENLDDFTVTETVKGDKEWIECSGRGICDHEVGTCTCATGYASSNGQGGSGTLNDCGYKTPIVATEE